VPLKGKHIEQLECNKRFERIRKWQENEDG